MINLFGFHVSAAVRRATLVTVGLVLLAGLVPAADLQLREFIPTKDPTHATIRIDASRCSTNPIPRFITGKFAEHLGFNIYNGMDAQILRNPTFADYPFWTGAMTPDGVTKFQVDDDTIAEQLRRLAKRFGAPEVDLDNLVQSRTDALAALWLRVGPRQAVQFSPDAGTHGRAQRVEVQAAGQGIAQWGYLPLHRVRKYEFEILVRSPDLTALQLRLAPAADDSSNTSRSRSATATASVIGPEWKLVSGTITLPSEAPADAPHRLELTAPSRGQFVLGHVFLRPADHVQGADPDVVKFLRESHLPILRWPGGNFVSTYHWEDAVGPIAKRPTKPNFAWGALELNTFGTDEFIAFCRAVGCEPMICINGGSGTPEEAARWIEYCNGPTNSPMGARRAANGHPEPYNVRHWEVGNELWGRWQMGWTTARGYVDRFKIFSEAMLRADSTIRLYACGAPVMWGKQWNDTLIAGAGAQLDSTTDHPLIGGDVSVDVEPLDVYRDFMAVPEVLEKKWRALESDMARGGVKEPRLAVTELQMFAHLGSKRGDAPVRLTRDNLVTPASMAEALYDVLIYHAAVRLAPFVEMVTHSATVNHGGGLRKERERVWANPCHYAQSAFTVFAGATAVPVEIAAEMEPAPLVLPELRGVTREESFAAVDALAAVATNGDLLLSIVHRGCERRLRIAIDVEHFRPAGTAQVRTLSAEVPWAVNTREQPTAVAPVDSALGVPGGKIHLDVPAFSVVRVIVPAR